MSDESWSFAVQLWPDPGTGVTSIQVVRVDEAKVLHLSSSSYVVRIMIDQEHGITRCLMRHVGSGCEAYLQGGSGLKAFVEDCLLEQPLSKPAASDRAGEQAAR
jgi:hypothetical protein